MKKAYNILATILFLFILFAFPVATKLTPNKDKSFFENRDLKKVPEYSSASLFDGSYLPQWEEYLSDHIAYRDEMIYAYTYINANIFKKVNVNDIIITDKALLPYNEPKEINEEEIKSQSEKMADKLSVLNKACEDVGAKFLYVGIPEQRSILRADYPSYLENDDKYLDTVEKEFFSSLDTRGIQYINMMDVFKNEDYRSYYSVTDHHYNIFGAFKTYAEITNTLLEDGVPLEKHVEEDFNLVELKNDFYGSRAKMIYKAYSMPDNLAYYELKEAIPFNRFDSDIEIYPARMCFAPKSETEDITYNVYMGGDNAETYVFTHRPELPNVLIFGDSFTNPLETLLYTSFNKMLALDLRHNKKKSIYEYIEEFNPDVVLLVRDDTCYLSFDGNGGF